MAMFKFQCRNQGTVQVDGCAVHGICVAFDLDLHRHCLHQEFPMKNCHEICLHPGNIPTYSNNKEGKLVDMRQLAMLAIPKFIVRVCFNHRSYIN